MNLAVTLLSLLAIVLLTAGNALFTAAEFSLDHPRAQHCRGQRA